MEARCTLLGQRVEQVSQEAQYQMERPARIRCHCPSWRSLTILFGGCSMNVVHRASGRAFTTLKTASDRSAGERFNFSHNIQLHGLAGDDHLFLFQLNSPLLGISGIGMKF